MIRVENLTKVFGPEPERALPMLERGMTKDQIRDETGMTVGVDDVSFELEPGEIFVIMGLSGSGKSTLLRCVNRLIEPTAGSVFIRTDKEDRAEGGGGELNVTTASEEELRDIRKRRMSMVFQRFGLLPHRSVIDNVAYGLEVQGRPKRERYETSEEMLEIVGLGGWGESLTGELSGGMQQRVGLARALATGAEVLLMDEPFSALDPLIKVNMQDELLRIQDELHRTLLFITHDLDEALRIGSRIAIMEGGRVVQFGTPEEIIVNPKTEYVADFVEHADPTGVMTARTVALPVPGNYFEEVDRRPGATSYIRRGYPEKRYVVDDDGGFVAFEVDGERVEPVRLADALDAETPELRRRDAVITIRPDTTLRQVLRGRTYSMLPQLVLDESGCLTGVVSERELMWGILEKRAYREVARAAVDESGEPKDEADERRRREEEKRRQAARPQSAEKRENRGAGRTPSEGAATAK